MTTTLILAIIAVGAGALIALNLAIERAEEEEERRAYPWED